MYHSDETRFYQTDDSKVTRRLLKEKSKLTFVDVLIKICIACLLKEVKNNLFSFRHSYLRHLSRRFKNYNIRACVHMILGQLWMGARHTIYAPLPLHLGDPLVLHLP